MVYQNKTSELTGTSVGSVHSAHAGSGHLEGIGRKRRSLSAKRKGGGSREAARDKR